MISVKYDIMYPPFLSPKGKYAEEISILIDFDKSNHNNVCFEYDSHGQARVATATLLRHIKAANLNVGVAQRGNLVYLIHKEVK